MYLQQILLTNEQACALRFAVWEARKSYRSLATLGGEKAGDPWYDYMMSEASACDTLEDILNRPEYVKYPFGDDAGNFLNIEECPFAKEA